MASRRSQHRYEDIMEIEEEWLDLDDPDADNLKRRRPERMKTEPDRPRKRDKPRWETPPHKREDTV